MGGVLRLLSRLGAQGDALRAPFPTALRQYEDERHRRIIERPQSQAFPSRNPPGWRAEDVLGWEDGFLRLAEAARALALTEAETVEACRRGLLEAEERGGALYVRPAIVSGLGTRA